MKNVLNIKMRILHTYYLLQIKITAYTVEMNSSTISEASCPLANVTNPYTVPLAGFCIFARYIDLRILLPCNCHLVQLWLHLITKFLLSSIAQYQGNLFWLIKHSSNSFWLFYNVFLMGDYFLENRNLLEEGDETMHGGSRDLRYPWCILLRFFPLWSPSCVLLSLASLHDDGHIKSEIPLSCPLQIDDGCAC